MKFKPTPTASSAAKRRAGFTLAEVLAALTFMAIVIPVAVNGLRLASQVGSLGERKNTAMRIAERTLNEIMVTGQWKDAPPSGTAQESGVEYRWQARTDNWTEDPLRLVTVQVVFAVQGKEYDVNLSTLGDSSLQ